MNSKENLDVKSLLFRLLDLIQPNNSRIDAIKEDDAKAKETIEVVEEENKNLNKELNETEKNIESIIAFKDDLVPLGQKHVSVIEKNEIPFDLTAIIEVCRKTTESDQKKVEEYKAKIADNEVKKEEATEVVGDTESRLKEEKDSRQAVANLIETILDKMEEHDYTVPRIRNTIKKLNEFTDEEIEAMLQQICFPKTGLVLAYEEYEGRGKTTSEMVKEALSAKVSEPEIESDIKEEKKIDDNKENTIKVVKTEKTPKVEENKKEEIKGNIDVTDYLFNNFGITKEDLEFTPGLKDIPLKDLEEDYEKLIAAGIDPISVRGKTLVKRLVDNLILNAAAFTNSGYNLDSQSIAKNIGILDVVPNNMVYENIDLIHQYGLNLIKQNGKVAIGVVSKVKSKLKNAILLMSEADLTYFTEHPENMDNIIGDVVARILYCKQNGIEYKDDLSVIESPEEFKNTYGIDIDKSYIPSLKACNTSLLEMIDNIEVIEHLKTFQQSDDYYKQIDLNDEQISKLRELDDIINQINTSEDLTVLNINNEPVLAADVYKNLQYLISQKVNASNESLLLGSIMFNRHKEPSAVKEIKNALDPNTRGLGLAA